MAILNVNPNRMELKKLKTRLITAKRGHKLLKDKYDSLMKKFSDIEKTNKGLREKIESEIMNVHNGFTIASAMLSPHVFEEALMIPKTERELTISYQNIIGVNVPVFDVTPTKDESINYGFAFTSGELDSSVCALNEMLFDLIKLAEVEKTSQILADAIEKTRRRVTALEYIMIPQLQETIKSIAMKLDENERENHIRLMKAKDTISLLL